MSTHSYNTRSKSKVAARPVADKKTNKKDTAYDRWKVVQRERAPERESKHPQRDSHRDDGIWSDLHGDAAMPGLTDSPFNEFADVL